MYVHATPPTINIPEPIRDFVIFINMYQYYFVQRCRLVMVPIVSNSTQRSSWFTTTTGLVRFKHRSFVSASLSGPGATRGVTGRAARGVGGLTHNLHTSHVFHVLTCSFFTPLIVISRRCPTASGRNLTTPASTRWVRNMFALYKTET